MRRLLPESSLVPMALGLSDGILNALTLSAGRLVDKNEKVTVGLAGAIAVASLVAGSFVFFVSNYHQLRAELIRAETQLNLTSHGRLAASRLGSAVIREALQTAAVASGYSFLGALVPLLMGAFLPEFRWAAVAVSLASLGVLGLLLARSVHGRYWLWGGGLLCGGLVVLIVGIKLRIVS